MLAIQRQVVHGFVYQQTSEQGDIGVAAFQHRFRYRRNTHGLLALVAHYRAAIDQYTEDAAQLSEACAVLEADDLVLVSLVARKLRRRYVDDGLRYRIVKAQAAVVDFVTAAARSAAVFTDQLARVLGLRLRLCFSNKQALLVCVEQDLLLGFAAEDLPLEPLELCPELAVLGLESGDADRCRIGCAYGVNCLFRLRNHAADFTMPIA